MKPFLSIIVPVYNVEKYLIECINSLCKQQYDNVEVILVDDGSTDDSGCICDEWLNTDLFVSVIHQRNNGSSYARNKGRELCKGDLILFFDSDDSLESHAIEKIISELNNKCADIVIIDANTIDSESNRITTPSYIRKKKYGLHTGKHILQEMLNNSDYHVAPWMYVFSHDFLLDNGLQFEEHIMCEDELFTFLAMYRANNVLHLNEPLLNHRIHSSSITKLNRRGVFRFRSLCTVLFRLEQNKRLIEIDSLYSQYQVRISKSILWCYHHLKDREKKIVSNEWNEFRSILSQNMYYYDSALKIRTNYWYLGMLISFMKKVKNKWKVMFSF